MIAQQRKLAMLERTANQILATVAPTTAHLLPARILLETQRDTASTDGRTVIFMPVSFCGHAIPDAEALSVGLLAHEVSHFLQPLRAIDEVASAEQIPHWLANIVLDVQGESLIETIFPSLASPLMTVRGVVADAQMAEYRQALAQAQTIEEAAGNLLLYCRFAISQQPFTAQSAEDWYHGDFGARGCELARAVAQAVTTPSAMLDTFLAHLIKRFPELRQAQAPRLIPFAPPTVDDGQLAGVLRREIQQQVGQWHGGSGKAILRKQYRVEPPRPEALRLARQLSPRFASTQGDIEVIAPGRFDRRAAARGELPFRLALPGHEQPAPNVVICVDVSSSMDGYKQRAAFTAAQALALAIQQGNGHVVGLLFDERAAIAWNEESTPLFARRQEWRNEDGTCFRFLTKAWRGWPNHWILLITDGQGEVPGALPQDKGRTAALVIPDGDADALRPICYRVIELHRLDLLPTLLPTLLPRTQIG
jgi:hypothetical protein